MYELLFQSTEANAGWKHAFSPATRFYTHSVIQ